MQFSGDGVRGPCMYVEGLLECSDETYIRPLGGSHWYIKGSSGTGAASRAVPLLKP